VEHKVAKAKLLEEVAALEEQQRQKADLEEIEANEVAKKNAHAKAHEQLTKRKQKRSKRKISLKMDSIS